jgi:hypothetical protein
MGGYTTTSKSSGWITNEFTVVNTQHLIFGDSQAVVTIRAKSLNKQLKTIAYHQGCEIFAAKIL